MISRYPDLLVVFLLLAARGPEVFPEEWCQAPEWADLPGKEKAPGRNPRGLREEQGQKTSFSDMIMLRPLELMPDDTGSRNVPERLPLTVRLGTPVRFTVFGTLNISRA